MSKAGVCKIDITPPIGIDFIGYHRPSGIRNIDERIYATSIVLQRKETKTVIVSIDNIGMLIEDTLVIRKQIALELNISLENVTVVYTHTHSGPATASNNEKVKSYKTFLISNAVQSAVQANERMQPCEVGWDVTKGEIGVNRREETSEGKVIMGTNVEGIVDHRVGVLAIRDQNSKNYIGIIIFCTAHPNVLKSDSERLSADYPGLTRNIIEKKVHCPVITIQGAAGNINAKYRGSEQALEKMANLLSGSVLKMLPTVGFKSIFKLRTKSATLTMQLKEIPGPESVKNMAISAEKQWGVNTNRWSTAVTEKYHQKIRQLSIDLEIQLFQINEGSFSGIPMEPFSETALEIKEKRKNDLAFFGGYTNGYLGYLPTKEAHPFGGYEVELNPVVYGPITKLWMPPVEDTPAQVVNKVLKLYES